MSKAMNQKPTQHYKQLKHISDATLLEEASHVRMIFRGIIAMAVILLAMIVWSAFITVQEKSTTYGQLIPKGEVQVVQHLEGGIVTKVYVNEGDSVKQGQLLVQLDVTQDTAQLEELRSQEVAFLLESLRLNAFLNNKPANIAEWNQKILDSKYNPIKSKDQIAILLQNQKNLLESQYANIRHQQDIQKNTAALRREKLKELIEQRKIVYENLQLLNQEFAMYAKLRTSQYVSHKDYLTVLRAVNQAKGDVSKLDSEIEQTKEAIEEAENKLKTLIETARKEALEQLAKAEGSLLEVRHKIERLEDQLKRTSIIAPVAGIVKGIMAYAGNVIKPGGTLMEIVPQSGQLQVESKILPQEVGYVKVGDKVNVKVLTYDYARYGSIKGTLKNISASTFMDQDNKPFYKAIIELDKQYLGADKNARPLKAGMTVQADILTGEKSLLEYLLKPIQRSVSDAFHER